MDTRNDRSQFSIFCHGCYTLENYNTRPRLCKYCRSQLLEDVTNRNLQRAPEPVYTPPPNVVERVEPLIILNNQIISREKLEQKTTKVNPSLEPFTCTTKSVEEDDCSICLEKFLKADLIPITSEIEPDQAVKWSKCGHTFHHKCIERWVMKNTSCPMCRTELHV